MFINSSQEGHAIAVLTEFVIVGFPGPPDMQLLLFAIFLLIYLLTITSNFTIVGLVWIDKRLHTPMYFFLGNYSFLEIVYVSTTVPKLLDIFLTGNHSISFSACITQLYFFTTLGTTEVLFLMVMSYDRYLAISYPLHYATTMTLKFCVFLVLGCWLVTAVSLSFPLFLVATLPFCGPNEVDHFLCESAPLFKLSCSDTTSIKTIYTILACFIVSSAFTLIMVSYISVLITIIRMPSTSGKQKAFSTCNSHLTVVIIFFLTVGVIYVRPSEEDVLRNKVAAVFYGVVTPCLNPFIYSLRNKDMKKALVSVLIKTKWLANSQ